ncbi:LytR/AlgR family response regulator transcription factor [Acanthopleuribacter pedis]|uniref:Response regulator transcription factor n=1 Tax=Acanthopleuribacter pedis TaxID=442870 RepID=A0A8J7U2M8_9BACT|nr:LytTR family DNA-binding domain-containing protein [Acanthopleuribacter pedis]MBO1319488.1 response regulator transcription factor [Acanthopleuribacter pedis]
MNILIVEDERIIAERLARFVKAELGTARHHLDMVPSLAAARARTHTQPWSLVFLDLNLKGGDGFDLLKDAVAASFHTVVVSAYTDRAFEAFQYGVFDFIGKPFDQARIAKTLNAFTTNQRGQADTRVLAVKKGRELILVPLEEIRFIKAANNYSELHLVSGAEELHNKPLEQLERLLPKAWLRVHKSYIVPKHRIRAWQSVASGTQVELDDGERIPVSRRRYLKFKQAWLT